MRAISVVGAWGIFLAAFGCESEPIGSGDRDQLIAELCAEFESCCTTAGLPVDGAKCRAHYSRRVSPGYEQAKADACLAELQALGADKCLWISVATPICSQVFAGNGTAKPGEDCQIEDCAPSPKGETQCMHSLLDDDVTYLQQCQLLLPGVEGSSPCVGDVKDNAVHLRGNVGPIPTEGYLCDYESEIACDGRNGTCQPLAALGEYCNLIGTADCISSAYCDFNDDTCQPRLPLGAACPNDESCEATGYCSNGTCAPRQAHGTPCQNSSECLANTCLNSTCQPTNEFALFLLCGEN